MRVASIVLVVLAVLGETAAAESVPDHETRMLASNATQLARLGRCGMALEVGAQVAQRDAAYYQKTVAADAGLFACVTDVDTEQRYQSWRDRQPRTITHRLGVDAIASMGMIAVAGGMLRYEHSMGLVVRLGAARAQSILEGPRLDVFAAHAGIRSYVGRFYLYAEAGGAAVHKHARYVSSDEKRPEKWLGVPSLAAGLGGKFGRVDLGISGLLPSLGIGLHLGFDFVQL